MPAPKRGHKMRIKFAASILAFAVAGAAQAVVVPNGDFEAGNTSFTSGYTHVIPGPGALYPEAVYTVDTNAQASHPSFYSFGDHTSGAGNFLIVNGAGTAGVAVWTSSTIAVSANTEYDFSAFLSSVYPASPALLEFTVTGNAGPAMSLGTFGAPSTAAVWSGVSGRFNSGLSTLVTLSIVNQNTELSGNDFGIDDIALSAAPVPEPASWAMLLSGFALVGSAARRRRMVPVAP